MAMQDEEEFDKMACEPWLLIEDGYLKVDANVKEIIYHSSLNVILICTPNGLVRVLDVNSGVILQSTDLSGQNGDAVKCKFIPIQNRVLFCDGQAIGVRTDYHGVLLLDSILQKCTTDGQETIKIELLFSEAVTLKEGLINSGGPDSEHIIKQLNNATEAAIAAQKKGIKAQKWNTTCISSPLNDLKQSTSSVLTEHLLKKTQSLELQVASAVHERITELLDEPTNANDKKMMASESRRRETFSQWPHMDYKWALPGQMAQAGFYHLPNSAGDDRAMCFTCSVCLVSWERTDEPWSEHERHSPECPFVVGEYTQNVPISVSNATGPALDATFGGSKVTILGSSSISMYFPTCTEEGLVSVFDVSGKIKRMMSFYVTQFDSPILDKITVDFGVLGNEEKKNSITKKVTALAIVSDEEEKKTRPVIVCGLTITQTSNSELKSRLYLVVYDFNFKKNDGESEDEKLEMKPNELEKMEGYLDTDPIIHGAAFDQLTNIIDDIGNTEEYSLIKELTSFYKTLIPGESETIFSPPSAPSSSTTKKKGTRRLAVNEYDPEFLKQLPNTYIHESSDFSISDNINELKKSNQTLNHSHAVQCVALPEECKQGGNLEVKSILSTNNNSHILVTVCGTDSSFLVLYKLNVEGKMVKVGDEVWVRELAGDERPVEVGILPDSAKTRVSGKEGSAVLVCADGAVRIVDLATLSIVSLARIDSGGFVSAAYCNSLDRLCASTKEGSLHFFALNDSDNESVEDHDEDDMYIDFTPFKEMSAVDKMESLYFSEPPCKIKFDDLATMQKLTHFSPILHAYSVAVPPCWSEFQQAMRQRRVTPTASNECFTKTWRLQTDTTTWEEHVFEITLPSTVVLGHVDLHFTLQSGCTRPTVEVSLLRQTKGGIGHSKDVRFAVDDTVTIDMFRRVENPVISEEYLRAHNADILAGPVNVADYVDLTGNTGTVTLTSPRMFKVKVRNLLLHVRAVYDKDDKKPRRHDSKGNLINEKTKKEYLGCDCIHELSVAIYTPSVNSEIIHGKNLRNLMLESNIFVQSLILTAVSSNRETLRNVMDILNWVAAIRLIPNRCSNGEAPNDQLEFMFINGIADNLTGLLRQCLLWGGRSIAHKCMTYIMTCVRGGKNISKSISEHFNQSVLLSLMAIIKEIKDVKSAAGLHWIFTLILNFTKKEQEKNVFARCARLLQQVSEELAQRQNSYHLLLRTRYGLYGLPTEPELFDVEPPLLVKGSSTTSFNTFGTNITSNDGSSSVNVAANDVGHQIINHKEALTKDNASSSSINIEKMKYKNIAVPKLVKGLIETEPLHFTCINTSEGTRLELADSVSCPNAQSAYMPIVVTGSNFSSPLHPKSENFAQNLLEIKKCLKEGNVSIVSSTASSLSNLGKLDVGKMLEDAQNVFDQKMEMINNMYITTKSISQTNQQSSSSSKPYPYVFLAPPASSSTSAPPPQPPPTPQIQMSNGNGTLPWHQLLVAPPKQVIVVERMHSGARRHVTLDFGDTITLTDVLIPSCAELVSLSVDVWLYGPEIDPVRLVTATDIGSKNLLLNDLQPPPLCRYMKITLVGRYGMATTRCRIPLGYFYGHVVILPEDIPSDVYVKPTDLDKQLVVLTKLLEDISCRYSLACSKLKDYLQPFLVADVTNTMHLSNYINMLRDKGQNVTGQEYNKVYTAYQETLTYQQQLNTIRNVIGRIDSSKTSCGTSTDKLISIAENLLEVLLSLDPSNAEVPQELCQQLFKNLCVSQPSRLQLLSAVFLEKACGGERFWGGFLADGLVDLFSSNSNIFPQDKLFVLMIYLSRKSPQKSQILDAAMRVVYNCLKPLLNRNSLLLAVNVDMSLLSWLLMYLSLQLSLGKSNPDRWAWILGDLLLKPTLTPIDGPAKAKILASWHKNHWSAIKDFKHNKCKVFKKQKQGEVAKSWDDLRDPTCLRDLMMVTQKPPQFVETSNCLAVAKLLVRFVIRMDHSGSADMMLIAFKIISKLVTIAKLPLCQLLNEQQLLELINFCLTCNVPWAPFALSCFLQDTIDLSGDATDVNEMDTDDCRPISSSWPPSSPNFDIEVNDGVFIHLEECEPKPKTKTITNLPFPPLPSVYETDSNDSDIEEVMEAFEKVNKTMTTKVKVSTVTGNRVSASIDARLETGVLTSSEVALRKLCNRNGQNLLKNITNDMRQVVETEVAPWADAAAPSEPECTLSNLQMLSYCFNELFKNMPAMGAEKMENVLHLWLTINSISKDKFGSAAMQVVRLNVESASALMGALTMTPALSLTAWCLGLETLSMIICNSNTSKPWVDIPAITGLAGMAECIVTHKDFVQMLITLLSGSGASFPDKGAAGPTLCKALHDFLVRVQVRCDVMTPTSKLGNLYKSHILMVVYQLARPGGPISNRTGPLDAQCKLVQSILYLDFANIDIGIGMSTLESTAVLLNSYFVNGNGVKCVSTGEKAAVVNPLGDVFASVLGTDAKEKDRPVSYEDLLINLMKLLGKLVQTPIPYDNPFAMDTSEPSVSSQTDESKAEQIQNDLNSSQSATRFFADTVLQHHPTIVALCKCLTACQSSSLCMLTNISMKNLNNFSEPTTVSDAVFHILSLLVRKATRKELIMEPLLMFLSQTPQLSEPLVWFVLQVLDNQEAVRCFFNARGVTILCQSIVSSSNTPATISRNGTISTVMQHFKGLIGDGGSNGKGDSNLINLAPYSKIDCVSVTSQPADVLIQGGITGVAQRRARSALWSYNFCQDENYTELLLDLPNAILLKEVHLQPHAGSLATCPSFVAIETSSNGLQRLVPASHPLPTSGLTYIRLHLPTPKVVNCVLIRLYKPRVGNSIGLHQIKLMGTHAFGKAAVDSEDETYCNHSLGWLRLLHHCFTITKEMELKTYIVDAASKVPNLLQTCCGLLLVPSHILPVYLPCLEKVLRELALLSPENAVATIMILLDNRLSIVEPMMALDNSWQDRLMVNVSGYQSACELLYQICVHQDSNTAYRVNLVLDWLKEIWHECFNSNTKCNSAYISSIASIIWFSTQNSVQYDLQALITTDLFEMVYNLKMRSDNASLKCALDSLLCAFCYNRLELFPLLLEKIGVLVPNLSTGLSASICDDRKDCEGMTDDSKQHYANSEWRHLQIGSLSSLNLSKDQLETVALASRSPTAIQQLLDSGLPKLLNSAIYEFCQNTAQIPMANLDKVNNILQFFTNVCDEKTLRDWLGSADGSSFWPHLLHWLCKKSYDSLQSDHAQLEEVCVKFLSKCCLCHPDNQMRLATVLCDVIAMQQNGISGFLRRLILQLLLENEKVPVSIEADETLCKVQRSAQVYVPVHPAFKQTYNRTMLYLSTGTTLSDILEQHLFFSSAFKKDTCKDPGGKSLKLEDLTLIKNYFDADTLSDLSVAAGVTAKDKRAKDIKNMAVSTPQTKKKRYTCDGGLDVMDGRIVKCPAYADEPIPLTLNLGQVLRLMEGKVTNDWPCVHLKIGHGKANEDKPPNKDVLNLVNQQQPISSALQVFSSMGGLALLAQNLPTIYPETVRMSSQKDQVTDALDSEWTKLDAEPDDMFYEDIEESVSPPKSTGTISHIPSHSLTAFSLFLRLPGYAEVLLKDSKRALCLLRLMLGVTDDGEGGDIFQSSLATSLPTLPFEVLQKLYDTSPLCSDDGRLLRRMSITTGVVQLLLACLGILTHHSGGDKEQSKDSKTKEERQLYWAKGTGFGTGSTQQSWNVEQALNKQKNEEEHVTVLLQVLASYISPCDSNLNSLQENVLPAQFPELLSKSCLLPAISSYLRNDSVLDMARHIPLYRSVLKLLRALAASAQLIDLLLPQKKSGEPSVSALLKNMKGCVDTYAGKLRVQKTKTGKEWKNASILDKIEEIEDGEGLATLMPDIQNTASLVAKVTDGLEDEFDGDMESSFDRRMEISPEEQYIKLMKSLQFEEQPDGSVRFVVSHHFESLAKNTPEQSHPARVKRIAQETVTLSTSLPLSYSSSVFVRYDSSRLDVMKVLITGPSDTPYANGCFELDVFFPPDYPMSPMLINLETTGHHTVRFNPNLYNDGKVCLSVLNTWHGRPEEKWNSQTSSFLQVLVSIQSLILVPEPYFNEPGYERARGTPGGTTNSKDYNLNICQATVRWAMLDQIVNPCPCFKDIIHAHFYLKKREILEQVQKWIDELEMEAKKDRRTGRSSKKNRGASLESFKKIYKQLEEQLNKLKRPSSLGEEEEEEDEEEEEEESPTTPTNSMDVMVEEAEEDKQMEKMVDDMCK